MILCNYEYFNEGVNLLDNKVWEYNLVTKSKVQLYLYIGIKCN